MLDLGCGEGSFLRELRRAGYTDLVGVDRSPEQVAEAARHGEIGVRLGDILVDAAALADASHDVIISFDVLEHLRRDELLALAEHVRRALRPGGRWVIQVPSAESPLFGRIRYEDAPVAHSAKSVVRLALWKMIRLGLRVYLAVETGESGPDPIFSQNLVAVAQR